MKRDEDIKIAGYHGQRLKRKRKDDNGEAEYNCA